MAAVDVDVHQARKIANAKAKAAASGLENEGSGSRLRGDTEDLQVHEHVLCSIKAHQNGTLEIAPGASAMTN